MNVDQQTVHSFWGRHWTWDPVSYIAHYSWLMQAAHDHKNGCGPAIAFWKQFYRHYSSTGKVCYQIYSCFHLCTDVMMAPPLCLPTLSSHEKGQLRETLRARHSFYKYACILKWFRKFLVLKKKSLIAFKLLTHSIM